MNAQDGARSRLGLEAAGASRASGELWVKTTEDGNAHGETDKRVNAFSVSLFSQSVSWC